MTMTDHVKDYVASRKALGLSFREEERVLMRYAEHADAGGDEFVRINSVLDWARTAISVGEAQRRLRIVRGLAVFLHVGDDRHEVPHRDALGKRRRYRPPPCIPSPEEIRLIMTEALSLPPAGSLTPRTFHTIIGLIACTGLRRSEATGLLLGDLGPDGLLVRNTKNRRDRLVPLHESTRRALDDYLVARKRQGGPCEHLFVLASGRPVRPDYLTETFILLARKAGVRGKAGEPGPRLHDLRHGFAVRALEGCISSSRKDVGRHMLALSTTLGHARPVDTYWYLEATPVLMRQVSEATEKLHMTGKEKT
ncbi:MAG: tyrosine-type recombinase/integrase [Gammaproteobacteria bacterium]|nr:tyrosine-type recombinase/integrase [Gammaproteobacteria bacterium]